MSTILVNAPGSGGGNVNPYLLVARQLRKKGHTIKFANESDPALYKDKLASEGIEYYQIRQFNIRQDIDTDLRRILLSPLTNLKLVFQERIFPNLRDSYNDLSLLAADADLMISGTLGFAASLIHEKTGIPWVSLEMHPGACISSSQTVPPKWAWLRWPPFNSLLFARIYRTVLRYQIRLWSNEWVRLRKELGLPGNPNIYFDRHLSPCLQLAAFSEYFSPRAEDWPDIRHHTGFIRPLPGDEQLSPGLIKFLQEGEAPIVFTLGSAGRFLGGKFFSICLEMLRENRIRSVLACGAVSAELLEDFKRKAEGLSHVYVTGEEPYSELFERARLLVHQGGVGTTGEGLRAGVPMVLIPFGADQFDNANRIEKLKCGVWDYGRTLKPATLKLLLDEASKPEYRVQAESLSVKLKMENGLEKFVGYVEGFLRHTLGEKENE